ncbi:uncharacterized protein LOC116033435 [Ipomoea triloba]|uniref:uncharacterized protein LOC116033435 n=1 Tax=Ipomoea triloba TaxID=35885 RepID=UPI00125DBE05|nr:uncharacterized protein LOC116033435 [Ipomoea triloba]
MGICASAHVATESRRRRGGRLIMSTPAAAMVVNMNGALQEFRRPVKAADVLSDNPNCFLSNSEAMNVDSAMPQVAGDQDLQLGQLYFLLPVSMSHAPLSLQDMCALAIKASAALNDYYSPVAGAVLRRGSFDERVSGDCGNINRVDYYCNKRVS